MSAQERRDGRYRMTRAERDEAIADVMRLREELQQRQRETRADIGPPPHIAHKWAALNEREQRDVLRWAMRVARADARRILRDPSSEPTS